MYTWVYDMSEEIRHASAPTIQLLVVGNPNRSFGNLDHTGFEWDEPKLVYLRHTKRCKNDVYAGATTDI